MKHKFSALLLIMLLSILLSACSGNQKPVDSSSGSGALTENTAQTQENGVEQTFPYKDDEGRMRYKLEINGSEVQTENLPFTYPDEPKGGYYPLEDVLSHLA